MKGLFPKEVRGAILAFFLLSLGGLLLHLRIHPPTVSPFNWIPLVFGIVNTALLPLLFGSARTVAWAYVLTWATVVTGSVGMTYFSVIAWEGPVTPVTLILNSTLADILILAVKIPIAHGILTHFDLPGESGPRGCVS